MKVTESQNTTGKVIDEALIRQRGVKQLWQQRKVLLPNLTRVDLFNEEQQFSSFLSDGLSIINRMLKILAIRTSETKKEERNKLYQSFVQKLLPWQEVFQQDNQKLVQALALLFLDIVNIEPSEKFNIALNQLFLSLTQSLPMLEALFKDDRSFRIEMEHIKQDSI